MTVSSYNPSLESQIHCDTPFMQQGPESFCPHTTQPRVPRSVVQLKCSVSIERSAINNDVRTVSFQTDFEIKVFGPSSSFVEEKFIMHSEPFKNERNCGFEVVIFALVALTDVREIPASVRCQVDADIAKLLLLKKD
jgi:hypothetical protein